MDIWPLYFHTVTTGTALLAIAIRRSEIVHSFMVVTGTTTSTVVMGVKQSLQDLIQLISIY